MQSIRLMRYENSVVTATDDAILHDMMMPYNGIIKGVEMEHLGSNQIYVGAGRGMIKGRDFEVAEQTIYAKLSEDNPEPGRIIIRLDLANADEPISFISQIGTGGQLPELIQEKDCNYTAGIYEIPMATYTSEATKITDFKVTYETIQSWEENILNTREEIEANTNIGKIAGALPVKELIGDLGGLKFAQDEKGNWGYIPSGADTVLPFKSGVISLGVGIEFDVSSYAGYKNFTSDNFIIEYNSSISSSNGDNGFKKENVGATYHWPSVNINTYKNYNSATGILTAYINVSSTITPTICGTRTEKHNVNAYLIP